MSVIIAGLVIVSLQSFIEARNEKTEIKRRQKKTDVIVGITVMVMS